MAETNDCSTAPKDGTVINAKFEDGTETEARYSTLTRQWEVIYGPRKEWRRIGVCLKGHADLLVAADGRRPLKRLTRSELLPAVERTKREIGSGTKNAAAPKKRTPVRR
jgi:hypothetical protein